MKIKRILECCGVGGCPAIYEAENGDFIVIGTDMSNSVENLSDFGKVGENERIVKIPKSTMENAILNFKREKK